MLAAPGRLDNPREPMYEPTAERTESSGCSVSRRPARERFGPQRGPREGLGGAQPPKTNAVTSSSTGAIQRRGPAKAPTSVTWLARG